MSASGRANKGPNDDPFLTRWRRFVPPDMVRNIAFADGLPTALSPEDQLVSLTRQVNGIQVALLHLLDPDPPKEP